MKKENLNGQSAKAASAKVEMYVEESFADALLTSLAYMENGKGAIVGVDNLGEELAKVWVEKYVENNAICYKFCIEWVEGEEVNFHSITTDSTTWNDFAIFSGDFIIDTVEQEFWDIITEE